MGLYICQNKKALGHSGLDILYILPLFLQAPSLTKYLEVDVVPFLHIVLPSPDGGNIIEHQAHDKKVVGLNVPGFVCH